MSGAETRAGMNEGPALEQAVQEVRGQFATDAVMQQAMSRLTLAGYDRADFSLPSDRGDSVPTPDQGADNPVDATDKAQLRTMGSSMAGLVGAAAAAGATIATGGAAGIAIAAAAAVGAGSGLVANAVGHTIDRGDVEVRDAKGAIGELILAVRVTSEVEANEAAAIMQSEGATAVAQVTRGSMTAGVSSAGWTGG